jgi:hypothetical protein
MSGLLSGLRVLEFGDKTGSACGRFLATLGADVVKVEPAGGDPSRLDAIGAADPAWLAQNLGKRSVWKPSAIRPWRSPPRPTWSSTPSPPLVARRSASITPSWPPPTRA